ncbi:hypothetical protein [Hafnia paralvei]|uniref:hypothetical protein n=1 Tax=Hafnia paralvei TaxID=546367 RepID=UPI001F184EA5|nr:hypothetical protein [Hafnia paralvei]
MRRILAIAVRSVKTGMMKRGNPRSGLEGGCQAGVLGGSDWPPDSDAGTMVMWNSVF